MNTASHLSPEVRLVPRNHDVTSRTIGVDVVIETEDKPVWIGFLKPRGNTWRIASYAGNPDPRNLDGHFSTAKAAAEYLVRATRKLWEPLIVQNDDHR